MAEVYKFINSQLDIEYDIEFKAIGDVEATLHVVRNFRSFIDDLREEHISHEIGANFELEDIGVLNDEKFIIVQVRDIELALDTFGSTG